MKMLFFLVLMLIRHSRVSLKSPLSDVDVQARDDLSMKTSLGEIRVASGDEINLYSRDKVF